MKDAICVISSTVFMPLKEHLPSCWSKSWSWNNLLNPFLKTEIKVTFAKSTCNPPPNRRVLCFALKHNLLVRMLIENAEGKTLMLSWSEVIYSSFLWGYTALISKQQTNLRVRARFVVTSCYNWASRDKELSKQCWELNVGGAELQPLLVFLYVTQWPFHVQFMKFLVAPDNFFSLWASVLYSLCLPFLLVVHIGYSLALISAVSDGKES